MLLHSFFCKIAKKINLGKYVVRLGLVVMVLSSQVWASTTGLSLSSYSVRQGATLTQLNNLDKALKVIPPDRQGISHNLFESFQLEAGELIINNTGNANLVDAKGMIKGANKTSSSPAKVIILEVIGNKRTDISNGSIKILGEQALLILVSPQGISCNGCSFSSVDLVELRAGNIGSLDEEKIHWQGDAMKEVKIGGTGLSNLEGSLLISGKKIKIDGNVTVKDKLWLSTQTQPSELDSDMVADTTTEDTKTKGYTIEVMQGKISASHLELTTDSSSGGIKLGGSSDSDNKAILSSEKVLKINTSKLNIAAIITAQGEAQISGKAATVSALETQLPR